jgi:predicted transcriptional regulator
MPKLHEAIISIKPPFAEAILDGSKTVELRRKIPPLAIGTRLWIYATKPTGAVIGSAVVEKIVRGTPDEIWIKFSENAGISRIGFDSYFDGAKEAIGLVLRDVSRAKPVEIDQLRSLRTGFHPPQVMARLTDAEAASLGYLASA